MDLLIGAPVCRREWIIKQWYARTLLACAYADIKPEFLMVVDPRDPTLVEMEKLCKSSGHNLRSIFVEESRTADIRDWKPDRYRRMVYLRNKLLKGVRRLEPTYFLSLDTDMLLATEAVHALVSTQRETGWDAVGGKAYMTRRGRHAPSYAMFKHNSTSIRRPESSAVMRVDAIMAIKLMTPSAYHVDYEFDSKGEDIGWSRACKRERLVLGWNGEVVNKHVMDRDMLSDVDNRVGF